MSLQPDEGAGGAGQVQGEAERSDAQQTEGDVPPGAQEHRRGNSPKRDRVQRAARSAGEQRDLQGRGLEAAATHGSTCRGFARDEV